MVAYLGKCDLRISQHTYKYFLHFCQVRYTRWHYILHITPLSVKIGLILMFFFYIIQKLLNNARNLQFNDFFLDVSRFPFLRTVIIIIIHLIQRRLSRHPRSPTPPPRSPTVRSLMNCVEKLLLNVLCEWLNLPTSAWHPVWRSRAPWVVVYLWTRPVFTHLSH